MRSTATTKECPICQKAYTLPLWKSKLMQTCSKSCGYKLMRQKTKDKHEHSCIGCSKSFVATHTSKGKYCSHLCYAESLKTRGGKPNCLGCNKKLSAHGCVYCRECIALVKVGENHHRWIKDRSKLSRTSKQGERRTYAYNYWRGEVWKRDGFKCRIDSESCSGRIEAHHILPWRDFPDLHYQLNNGITLCHAHHPRARVEEKRLIPVFQELVSAPSESL